MIRVAHDAHEKRTYRTGIGNAIEQFAVDLHRLQSLCFGSVERSCFWLFAADDKFLYIRSTTAAPVAAIDGQPLACGQSGTRDLYFAYTLL